MKKYKIFFVILCVLTAVFFGYTVLHPRPHNVLMTIMSGIWTFCASRWMDTERYEGKARHAPGIATAILSMLISFVIVRNGLSIIPDLLFPYHMPYEYKGDIAKRRLSTFYDYSFFPDEIPTGAKHVKWIMMPSFLQGSGTEVLIFDTDSEYIQKVVAQYRGDAQVMGFEEGMMFGSYYDESRLDRLTVYKLYDNDDWNHLHMWGFFVDEEIGRIGYFCQ